MNDEDSNDEFRETIGDVGDDAVSTSHHSPRSDGDEGNSVVETDRHSEFDSDPIPSAQEQQRSSADPSLDGLSSAESRNRAEGGAKPRFPTSGRARGNMTTSEKNSKSCLVTMPTDDVEDVPTNLRLLNGALDHYVLRPCAMPLGHEFRARMQQSGKTGSTLYSRFLPIYRAEKEEGVSSSKAGKIDEGMVHDCHEQHSSTDAQRSVGEVNKTNGCVEELLLHVRVVDRVDVVMTSVALVYLQDMVEMAFVNDPTVDQICDRYQKSYLTRDHQQEPELQNSPLCAKLQQFKHKYASHVAADLRRGPLDPSKLFVRAPGVRLTIHSLLLSTSAWDSGVCSATQSRASSRSHTRNRSRGSFCFDDNGFNVNKTVFAMGVPSTLSSCVTVIEANDLSFRHVQDGTIARTCSKQLRIGCVNAIMDMDVGTDDDDNDVHVEEQPALGPAVYPCDCPRRLVEMTVSGARAFGTATSTAAGDSDGVIEAVETDVSIGAIGIGMTSDSINALYTLGFIGTSFVQSCQEFYAAGRRRTEHQWAVAAGKIIKLQGRLDDIVDVEKEPHPIRTLHSLCERNDGHALWLAAFTATNHHNRAKGGGNDYFALAVASRMRIIAHALPEWERVEAEMAGVHYDRFATVVSVWVTWLGA
jgi:hypothetical protein